MLRTITRCSPSFSRSASPRDAATRLYRRHVEGTTTPLGVPTQIIDASVSSTAAAMSHVAETNPATWPSASSLSTSGSTTVANPLRIAWTFDLMRSIPITRWPPRQARHTDAPHVP